MKRFAYVLAILVASYILFSLASNSQDKITGFALLENGNECNSNSECVSNYCSYNSGIGVGICSNLPSCNSLDYSTCSSSSECVLWRDGDQCILISQVDNINYQCSDLSTSSQCNKVSSLCQWSSSLNQCSTKTASSCGNNIIEGAEICDGTSLSSKTCSSWPTQYNGGTLKCNSLCSNYDFSSCSLNCNQISSQAQCSSFSQCLYYGGDGICTGLSYIQNPNECQYLSVTDCSKLNLCEIKNNVCAAKTTSSTCGNSIIENNEQCDSSYLNGKTCITQGYTSGTLKCYSNCSLDLSLCTKTIASRISYEEANRNLEQVTQFQANVQDLSLAELNTPPSLTLSSDIFELRTEEFSQILDLSLISYDAENDPLVYTLDYPEEQVDCKIEQSKLFCKKISQRLGVVRITLKVSDGISETKATLRINVGATVLEEVSKDAVGSGMFEENTAPIANAGLDQVVQKGRIIVLDASSSYDQEDNIPSTREAYSWYYNNNKIAIGKITSYKFDQIGSYEIELEVKDSLGLISKDSVIINAIEKNKCKETSSLYFPEDTICNKKWPSTDGKEIFINTKDYSCNLVEVCSEELDPIIEEAIDCCDGSILTDKKKANACILANKNSNGNSKRCQGLYIINGLGANAIFLQDYFEAEMCCAGVDSLCTNPNNLYKARPIPKANSPLNLNEITCKATQENNKGKWISDYDIKLNNIALTDLPAHATLTKLSTGTCVDYSLAMTTLLRKIGYSSNEIFTIEASNHAYNMVRFPLDKKYTIVDTTGNNNGLKLGSVPYGYDYCENIVKCYNDLGEMPCPSLTEVNGCENVNENLLLQTSRTRAKLNQNVKGVSVNFFQKIIQELGI